MKKMLLMVVFLIWAATSFSQDSTAISVPPVTTQPGNTTHNLQTTTSNLLTQNKNTSVDTKEMQCNICDAPMEFIDWLLVFTPIILFLFMLYFIKGNLKGFSLTDALNENEIIKKTISNPLYTNENLLAYKDNPTLLLLLTPTIEVSDYNKSSSRYIALYTSVLTWVIGVCFISFYIYVYRKSGVAPDLTKLTDVVLTLGIGVVPYAFNKVSNAMKSNDKSS